MPITAKICGLSTPETLDAAIRGGASHVGFVFFPPSPRNLSRDRAAQLAARVPGHVSRVGVFVDPDDEQLDSAIAAGSLHALQIHNGTPARIAAIRARTGLHLWAAVAVKSRADLAAAATFAGAALPGGMGVRFDWSLLQDFRHPLPWALSGGLDPLNVAEAVAITRAPMVDVSSGVESTPGIKDATKIAAFLDTVKQL